jgi:hypothetical protein
MSTLSGGPNTVTDNLVLYLDAANPKSYVSGSTVAYSLVRSGSYFSPVSCSLVNGVGYSTNNLGHFIFDGTNDQILVENTPVQTTGIRLGTGTTRWAVNAWVRTTSGNSSLGQSPVLSNRSGGPVYSNMGVAGNGTMKYEHYSGSWLLKTGSIVVNDNRWHMLSWVNLNNNTMDMYVDGVFNVNVSSSIVGGSNPVDIIGASWNSFFSGSIASLSIYIGSTFTPTQVLQNYNTVKTRFGL